MESEYEAKIIELQVYLPALEKRITDARYRKDSLVSGRLEKLRDIVNKKIKVPIGILLKTEDAIKKFIKDSSVTNKPVERETIAPSTNLSSPNIIDKYKKPSSTAGNSTVIKGETRTAPPTTGHSVDSDDNDDVEFVASSSNSDTIILLDSDSSDDEREKRTEKNVTEIQTKFKCEQLETKRIPSPISKEIVKVKGAKENCDKNLNSPHSPGYKNCDTVKTETDTGEVLLVINVIPKCDEIVCIDDDDDDDVEQDPCDKTIAKSQVYESKNLPQVQFDANKVAQSRGILHEIESQLKQLTSATPLSLSLDNLVKEDSIDKFLSKTNDLSPTKEQELSEAQIVGPKDIDASVGEERSSDKSDKRVKSPENTLPFPLLHFGKPSGELETFSCNSRQRERFHSGSKADANDSIQSYERISPVDNNTQRFNICNAETSSTMPLEYAPSSDYTTDGQEVISDAELTTKANERLADIIASLRRNLSQKEESTKEGPAAVEISKDKPTEIFVNKMQMTDIPSLVQDMLAESFVSEDLDDEDGKSLVIDDSIVNKDLSDQLLADLDNSVNSINDIGDLPTGSLLQNDDEDDSLDREISQAMIEDTMKSSAHIDFDSSDLMEVKGVINDAEGTRNEKANNQENNKMQPQDEHKCKQDISTQNATEAKSIEILNEMDVGDVQNSIISVDPVSSGLQIATDDRGEEVHQKSLDINIPPKFESKERETTKLETDTSNEDIDKSSKNLKEFENQVQKAKKQIHESEQQEQKSVNQEEERMIFQPKDNEKQISVEKTSNIQECNLLSSCNMESEKHLPDSKDLQESDAKGRIVAREEDNFCNSFLESTPELKINTSSDVTFDEKDVNEKLIRAVSEERKSESETCKENSEIALCSKRLTETCSVPSSSNTKEIGGEKVNTVSPVGEKDSQDLQVAVVPNKVQTCPVDESLNAKKLDVEMTTANKCVGLSASSLETDLQASAIQEEIVRESAENKCVSTTAQFKTIEPQSESEPKTKVVPVTEERLVMSPATKLNQLNPESNFQAVDEDVFEMRKDPLEDLELAHLKTAEEDEHTNIVGKHASLNEDTTAISIAEKSVKQSFKLNNSKNVSSEVESSDTGHRSDSQQVESLNENIIMSPRKQGAEQIEGQSEEFNPIHSTPKPRHRKIELDDTLTPGKQEEMTKSPKSSGTKTFDTETSAEKKKDVDETVLEKVDVANGNNDAGVSAIHSSAGQELERAKRIVGIEDIDCSGKYENTAKISQSISQEIAPSIKTKPVLTVSKPDLNSEEIHVEKASSENLAKSSELMPKDVGKTETVTTHLNIEPSKSIDASNENKNMSLVDDLTTNNKSQTDLNVEFDGKDCSNNDISQIKHLPNSESTLLDTEKIIRTRETFPLDERVVPPIDSIPGTPLRDEQDESEIEKIPNLSEVTATDVDNSTAIESISNMDQGTPVRDELDRISSMRSAESNMTPIKDETHVSVKSIQEDPTRLSALLSAQPTHLQTVILDEREVPQISLIPGTPLRDEEVEFENEKIPNLTEVKATVVANSAAIESISSTDQGTPVRDELTRTSIMSSTESNPTPTKDEPPVSIPPRQDDTTQLSAFSEISQINKECSGIFTKINARSPEIPARKIGEMQTEEASNSSTNMEGESKEANLAALMQAEYHDRLMHIMTPLDASQDAKEFQSKALETSSRDANSVRVVASFSKAIRSALGPRNAKNSVSILESSIKENQIESTVRDSVKTEATAESTTKLKSGGTVSVDSEQEHSKTNSENTSEKGHSLDSNVPSKNSKEADRVIATFSGQTSDLKDLLRRRKELENKLAASLEDNVERPQTTSNVTETTNECENLSEISTSEEDCISLSLSDISDPESGELIEKPPIPKPKVKIESSLNEDDALVAQRLRFAPDPSKSDIAPLQITIKNKVEEFDLRSKLLAKRRGDAGDELDEGKLKHRKKKKKKKSKRKKDSAQSSTYLPVSIENTYESREMVPYVSANPYSDDSCGSDLPEFEPVYVKQEHPERSHRRLKVGSSISGDRHPYIKSEFDEAESHCDVKETWNRTIKKESIDEKLMLQRELQARLAALNAEIYSDQTSRRQHSITPTSERYFKTDPTSPGRYSDSPESDRKSPSILLQRSSIELAKSPIRSNVFEKRRALPTKRLSRPSSRNSSSPIERSRSPRRSSRSPRRKLSRSPVYRVKSHVTRTSPKRRSRSPRNRTRSPTRLYSGLNRRSRSPRRRSRSPRRRSRSPRRRSISPRRRVRSPRRRSRSPRRRSGSPIGRARTARRRSRSPRRGKSKSPRRYSKSPRRRSKSPLRRLSRSPKKEAKSPSRTLKSPQDSSKRQATETNALKEEHLSNQSSNSPYRAGGLSVESQSIKSNNENSRIVCDVIDLSDSDDDERKTKRDEKQSPKDEVNEENNKVVDSCFTIEVSDDEDFVEAPPPPMISGDAKASPKREIDPEAMAQGSSNNQTMNIILTDDDQNDVPASTTIERQMDSVSGHPSDSFVANAVANPKQEPFLSKTEISEEIQEPLSDDFETNENYVPSDEDFEPPNGNMEALKEKNLNELHALKVKLEQQIGISPQLASQIIGSAVRNYDEASATEYPASNMDCYPPQSTFLMSTEFYEHMQRPVAQVSSKDPRLNRVNRPPLAPATTAPKFDDVPPPPPIPRLTPAVALSAPSQLSKNSKYDDEFSDEDNSSADSGSLDEDDASPKHGETFMRVGMSQLEALVKMCVEKIVREEKAATKAASKAPGSKGTKSKKDVAGSSATTPPTESSPPDTAKPKKARKNALSKDGSGPMHMTADKIISEIKKSMTPKSPVREKPLKAKTRHRIAKRIASSSESDEEVPARNSTSLSPKAKSPAMESSALRNKITNDVAGIIKLGKTPKSAKTKPTPALKLAEQISDVDLLKPLREIPYDDKRKKKPETGGSKKQKRIPKNTDMSMHCNSGEKSCLLCKEMEKGEELISHYVNVHRENEVFVARLELGQVETLRQSPNLVKPVLGSNIEKYSGKCPFCLEEMTCPIGRFMEHFASHTGEFAYECDCCGTRDSRKRDLLQHCNTACDKGAKFIYVYRYDLSTKVIQAYVCAQCNYTQLNSANVIKHIRTEHDQQQVSSTDYIPVTLFEIDTAEQHDDAKVAKVVDDKIQVNNEAIAYEDDDYDAYDNFEYAPSPESDTPREAPPSEAIEYVKNELIMDAIDAIDWKSIEDTLADSDHSPQHTKDATSTFQQPTISLNESLHIVPKNEALDQSVCNLKTADIGTQIFTEIHAMASESPSKITDLAPEVKPDVSRSAPETSVASSSVKNVNVPSVEKTKPSKDVSNDASTAKKVTKFKPFDSTNKNITRVQSIGIETIGPYRYTFQCFVLDCDFRAADTLEDLRKHMRKHQHKWTGQCVACRKKSAKKSLSMDREFLHLINEHLPQKSFASNLLRPWIANDPSECYKTKGVCDMLLNEFHLENLYKCMGPNCVFTTNSSKDMQFHVTLNHSDDVSALYCCYCPEQFLHANALVDHAGKTHGASKYQCTACFYRSCAAYNVQMHQRSFHKDEKTLKIIVCNGQTHTFSTEILEIMDNRLRNVKPLTCPFFSACRKLIFVKHLLLDHIVKDHSRREPTDINSALYDCIYCGFGTTDLLSIRQHMANEHPSQLLYVCGLVFIKSLHPLASQNNVDITSIKTTSLVYIGDLVNKKKFTIKCSNATNFEANTIEAVNHGCDATALNERIRQMFGEAAISFKDVESYVRKIAEGMQPDTIKEEERSELDQLVNAAIKNSGFVGKELYKCGFSKCDHTSDNFEQFDRHIASHSGNKKEPIYRCPHCNQIIPTNQIRMHTIQHRRHRYLCIFCGKSSPSQNLAIEHLKLGHQSQSNVFEYLTSDKDWNLKFGEQEGRIFVAMPRKHDGDTIEKVVEVLRKRFGPKNAVDEAEEAPLERPQSPVERKEETIVPVFVSLDNRLCCNIDACPFIAKTDEELMQHISERHLIIMSGRYSCAHCPYSMSGAQMRISRIGNHLQYHGPTIVLCNVCNYYHYNRLRVLNHISMCHPYNFVTMTLHARSTNGTKMKLEILYNKHIRSAEDSYKCTLCSAILTECEDFFIHMKEHHQLNVRFKCDMCPFFDNALPTVEEHLKKAHGDEEMPRIRSVFLPAGGKWVQNLSPFELLFDYSENVQPDPLNDGVRKEIPPNVSEVSQSTSMPTSNNTSSVAEDTVIKTEDSRKRKLDEPERYRPRPASKKIRKGGVKRPSSGSETTEEPSKRVKVSSSPDRSAAELAVENTSENLSHMELLATLESDFQADATVSNTRENLVTQNNEGLMKPVSDPVSKNKSNETLAKVAGRHSVSENIPEQHEKTKETPEPRLKVVPFEKLMAVPQKEQAPETSTNLSAAAEPADIEPTTTVVKIESPMTIFSPPQSSAPASVSSRVSPRRIKTEVFMLCYQCGAKSESFTKLRTHYRANHPGDVVYFRVAKKLLCAYCYTIAPFNEMKIHHFNTHSNDLFITRESTNHKKCAECGFESGDIQVLKNHVEAQHPNLYVQMHSSFEFLTQNYLEDLFKIGTGQIADVIRCLGCDHIYLQETICKNHITKAHPNITNAVPVRVAIKRLLYGCNQCSVFFETEMRAIQHIRKHIDPYGCNFCEMSFPTHNALEDHYRLFHKSTDQSYQFRNVSHNFKKFLEMQLRFSNGLVCGKFQLEHTDYGEHDQFLQRIELMEKHELRNWISRQERTEKIDTIARIKIEIEKEADMFVQSKGDEDPS